MSAQTSNNSRIAQNTIFLYIRMLFLMLISLYTSRVVLNALGIQDYGIYNVVGGFVGMFSMVSTSLAGAISRYITFSLAKSSLQHRQKVFSTAIVIQIIICVFIVVFGETIAMWFLNYHMVIPKERIVATNWVFQLSIITFIINVLSTPYNALIIAYEKMSAFAYIGIYEGAAKLAIAFAIPYSPIDSLVYYSILMCFISISTRLLYGRYCSKKFLETKGKLLFDKTLVKDMLGFAGWNFLGTTSGVLRDQGINLLINIFCGPVVNAARGISMQVNSAISGFSSNFMIAVRPQITKSFAIGDRTRYEDIVFKSSKFSFFLLMLLCIPIIVEAKYIISLWLVEVPSFTVEFVQLILILTLAESFSSSLVHLLLATGKIRKYQICVGGLQMLNFPLAYILLKLGTSPLSTVISTIFISCFCLYLRLYLLKGMMQFPVKRFLFQVIFRSISIFFLALILPIYVTYVLEQNLIRFGLNVIIAELLSITLIYFYGLTCSEKRILKDKVNKIKVYVKQGTH